GCLVRNVKVGSDHTTRIVVGYGAHRVFLPLAYLKGRHFGADGHRHVLYYSHFKLMGCHNFARANFLELHSYGVGTSFTEHRPKLAGGIGDREALSRTIFVA